MQTPHKKTLSSLEIKPWTFLQWTISINCFIRVPHKYGTWKVGKKSWPEAVILRFLTPSTTSYNSRLSKNHPAWTYTKSRLNWGLKGYSLQLYAGLFKLDLNQKTFSFKSITKAEKRPFLIKIKCLKLQMYHLKTSMYHQWFPYYSLRTPEWSNHLVSNRGVKKVWFFKLNIGCPSLNNPFNQ